MIGTKKKIKGSALNCAFVLDIECIADHVNRDMISLSISTCSSNISIPVSGLWIILSDKVIRKYEIAMHVL